MARIPETYNFGQVNDFSTMTRLLQTMYTRIAMAINGVNQYPTNALANPFHYKVPSIYVKNAAPVASAEVNSLFELGDQWIDTSSSPHQIYYLTARTDRDTVTWTVVN